jgi:hypothetical protein
LIAIRVFVSSTPSPSFIPAISTRLSLPATLTCSRSRYKTTEAASSLIRFARLLCTAARCDVRTLRSAISTTAAQCKRLSRGVRNSAPSWEDLVPEARAVEHI